MGALFTMVSSISVSRVGRASRVSRVRVTLTVTVRLVGLALWLVSGIALNKYRCEYGTHFCTIAVDAVLR